ncbi:hypothetical protein V1281_004224 [Nitrobacteraceae bacterium AZCC 2161]
MRTRTEVFHSIVAGERTFSFADWSTLYPFGDAADRVGSKLKLTPAQVRDRAADITVVLEVTVFTPETVPVVPAGVTCPAYTIHGWTPCLAGEVTT